MENYKTPLNEDLVARLLRKQIDELKGLIDNMERQGLLKGYTKETLKKVEDQIRWLRRVCFEYWPDSCENRGMNFNGSFIISNSKDL